MHQAADKLHIDAAEEQIEPRQVERLRSPGASWAPASQVAQQRVGEPDYYGTSRFGHLHDRGNLKFVLST